MIAPLLRISARLIRIGVRAALGKPVCVHEYGRRELRFYSVSRRREIVGICRKCGETHVLASADEGKGAA